MNGPSPELFTLLDWLSDAHKQMAEVARCEFQREELLALGELSPQQIYRLLTAGAL